MLRVQRGALSLPPNTAITKPWDGEVWRGAHEQHLQMLYLQIARLDSLGTSQVCSPSRFSLFRPLSPAPSHWVCLYFLSRGQGPPPPPHIVHFHVIWGIMGLQLSGSGV